MTYADSSFVVRLVTPEAGTPEVVALYRRLDRPRLLFTHLHELEVRNALRLKAFVEAQRLSPAKRNPVARRLIGWESRLEHFIRRGSFAPCAIDWENGMHSAEQLSARHTFSLGTRSFDLLHVAFALDLHCRYFLTCDLRQAALAKVCGLKTRVVDPD